MKKELKKKKSKKRKKRKMPSDLEKCQKYIEEGFQIVASSQGWGRYHTGVVILMKTGQPLTEDDYWTHRYASDIFKDITLSDHKKDPERPAREAKTKSDLLDCFPNDPIYYREIPNNYDGDMGEPWLMVTTNIGHIKIGWRRSVIVIDWSDTDVKTTAEELFPNENFTKYDNLIHAGGYHKAVEYLKVIHE